MQRVPVGVEAAIDRGVLPEGGYARILFTLFKMSADMRPGCQEIFLDNPGDAEMNRLAREEMTRCGAIREGFGYDYSFFGAKTVYRFHRGVNKDG